MKLTIDTTEPFDETTVTTLIVLLSSIKDEDGNPQFLIANASAVAEEQTVVPDGMEDGGPVSEPRQKLQAVPEPEEEEDLGLEEDGDDPADLYKACRAAAKEAVKGVSGKDDVRAALKIAGVERVAQLKGNVEAMKAFLEELDA